MLTQKTTINPRRSLLTLPLLLLLLVTACSDNDPVSVTPDPDEAQTLAEILASESNYSTLASLVTDDLLTALETEELTVFAPTNAAFSDIPSSVLESLTEEQVITILTYHLAEGTIPSSGAPAQGDLVTLQGERLLIRASGGSVTLNSGSDVVQADIQASNGVIHGIDQVLLPSAIRKALDQKNIIDIAEEAGSFETLLSAVEATGLTTTLQFLSPFTVFAPDDDAFDKLPSGLIASLTEAQIRSILLYHTIGATIASGDLDAEQAPASSTGEALYVTASNGSVSVNGNASVVAADIEAVNGIIHVIDEVLIPNELLNIVQIAQKNYELTTLVDLVIQQQLVDALTDDGPFTIFAPINAAFAAISDDLQSLTSDEVTDVLTYHVVADRIDSADIPSGSTELETLLGETITVVNDSGTVTVNGAEVITVDLSGTNGVIHLIDAVLLP